MKKVLFYLALQIILFSLFSCASQIRPVLVQDYYEEFGGKNLIVNVKMKNLDYDGKTVYGVPSEQDENVFAVLFKSKDESSNYDTNYGNTITIEKNHIEMVKVSNEKIATIAVEKYFYTKLSPLACIFATLNSLPCTYYFDELTITKDEKGKWGGNKIGMDFIHKKEIHEKIFITNIGNAPTKTPFIVVETLPDFLKFKSAKYIKKNCVQNVTYDIHEIGNKQVLIFKIYPNSKKGFNANDQISIMLDLQPLPEKLST
ncbi:hypothetical protein [Caldithrix abyssi]